MAIYSRERLVPERRNQSEPVILGPLGGQDLHTFQIQLCAFDQRKDKFGWEREREATHFKPLMLIHSLVVVSVFGNGDPFQYSCLENFMDREAWRAATHGAAESRT